MRFKFSKQRASGVRPIWSLRETPFFSGTELPLRSQ